jgi:ribosomal protein L20A (L18A)
MVKEFRALSRAEAVEAMYQDMAARHRARFRNVQILRVAEIEKTDDIRRPYIKQLLTPGLKFPLPHRRTTSKAWYAASRPVSVAEILAVTFADACSLLGRRVVSWSSMWWMVTLSCMEMNSLHFRVVGIA